MSWLQPEKRKVYETSDAQEAAFLRKATSWDVRLIYEQEEKASQQRSRGLDIEGALRQAYEENGLNYDERKRSEGDKPATGRKVAKVATDHLNRIARMHNSVRRASCSHRQAGRYGKAIEGYSACLKLNRMADEFLRAPDFKNGTPELVQKKLDHLHTLRGNIRKLKAKC